VQPYQRNPSAGAVEHVRRESSVGRGRLRGFDAARLRDARRAANLTLEVLAARADVSQAAIGAWELGSNAPEPQWIASVCRVLGITIRSLVNLAEEEAELRDFRSWRGLSQRQVASALGISDTLLGKIERHVRRPYPEQLDELAELYQVDTEMLAASWERGHNAMLHGTD